jgi:hypothetical protein
VHHRLLILTFLTLGTVSARAQAPALDTPTEPAAAPNAAASPAEVPRAPQPAAPAVAAEPPGPVVQTAPHPLRPYSADVHNPARTDAAVQHQLPQPYVTPPPSPPPPEPRRHGRAGAPFALALGPGFMWRGGSAQRVLTSDRANAGFELLATYDVWAPSARAVVAAGLDLRLEHLGDPDELAVWHRSVQAELQPRFRVTRWLWPHLRVAVGMVSTRFRLSDLGGLDFADHDVHVASTLGAGFTLRTPARLFETHRGRLSSFSIGVSIEGGYTFAKAATLRAKPTSDSDLTQATFALGDVERSGAYLRALGVFRF